MYSSKLDEILAHGKIRSQSTSASLVEMSAAEDEIRVRLIRCGPEGERA